MIYNEVIKYHEHEKSLTPIDRQIFYPFYILMASYGFADDHLGTAPFFFDDIESLSREVDMINAESDFDYFKRQVESEFISI